MKINTCYYSKGSKHECCNHKQYCIFNEKREKLEKEIVKSLNKYQELQKLQNSYLLGYTHDISDYDFHLQKMELVKQKILKLVKFREKILKKEIKGYEYGILESEGV